MTETTDLPPAARPLPDTGLDPDLDTDAEADRIVREFEGRAAGPEGRPPNYGD